MQVVSGRFLAALALVGTGLLTGGTADALTGGTADVLTGGTADVLTGGTADAKTFAYTIKDLGIVPGITYLESGITESFGVDVNDSGQVAGGSTQNSPYHSFLSAPGGRYATLRPAIVFGFGNPINLGNVIAVYARLCKELGFPYASREA